MDDKHTFDAQSPQHAIEATEEQASPRPDPYNNPAIKDGPVPIDLLKLPKDNLHLRLDAPIGDLIASITETGRIICPLIAKPDGSLVDGARRYRAAKECGLSDVPVIVIEGDDLNTELASIDLNLARRDLSDVELDYALLRRKSVYEAMHPEAKAGVAGACAKHGVENLPPSFVSIVAQVSGHSPSNIARRIRRARLASQKVWDAWRDGKLKSSQVDELANLRHEQQDQLLAVVKGKSLAATKKAVNAMLSGQPIPEIEALAHTSRDARLDAIKARMEGFIKLANQVFDDQRSKDDLGNVASLFTEFRITLKELCDRKCPPRIEPSLPKQHEYTDRFMRVAVDRVIETMSPEWDNPRLASVFVDLVQKRLIETEEDRVEFVKRVVYRALHDSQGNIKQDDRTKFSIENLNRISRAACDKASALPQIDENSKREVEVIELLKDWQGYRRARELEELVLSFVSLRYFNSEEEFLRLVEEAFERQDDREMAMTYFRKWFY